MPRAFLGLGSNLGDREDNLHRALGEIVASVEVSLLKASSVEETEPVDYLDQPPFLNQVVLIETGLEPLDLLHLMQNVEDSMGRRRIFPKGPRIIDIDLLLYEDLILNIRDLILPHPEIKNRDFVMRHLLEIEGNLRDPETNKSYREIMEDHGKNKEHQ